ncbi:MAG: ABC-F family ATP-binding cassette domain-containing protein, partial [Proteobacteria bacterium]
VTVYSGNYDFWRESSELNQRLRSDQLKKNSDKAEELKSFIRRFSANASKSSQASSRQKQLEKLDLGDLPVSTRKQPYVGFDQKREAGNDILTIDRLSKSIAGEVLLKDFSLNVKRGDKIILLGRNDVAKTALMDILAGDVQPDSGSFNWGITTNVSYFPQDNSKYFANTPHESLVDWLREYSDDKDESFVRGFLGKMLFSGTEALKSPKVLSGGEKVRCMLSKMMLSGANVLMFDGPTAHLDLESISAVNEGLKRYKGTILFTTHDHEFIQTTATRIVEIGADGRLKEDEYMTYDEFLAKHKPKH